MQALDIRDIAQSELLITWEDEHRSLYPYKYLRLKCHCAHCVDEWNGQLLVDPAKISDSVRAVSWAPVGRYGMKFQWSDGHNTGIYSFELLRRLCPCSRCLGIDNVVKSEVRD